MSYASAATLLHQPVEINPPKRRVLLVDDNEDLLVVHGAMLEEEGFEVAVAPGAIFAGFRLTKLDPPPENAVALTFPFTAWFPENVFPPAILARPVSESI